MNQGDIPVNDMFIMLEGALLGSMAAVANSPGTIAAAAATIPVKRRRVDDPASDDVWAFFFFGGCLSVPTHD